MPYSDFSIADAIELVLERQEQRPIGRDEVWPTCCEGWNRSVALLAERPSIKTKVDF